MAVLAGKRILVVEDDYLIASDLRRQLVAASAEVIGPVADVEGACRLIEADLPDAAVLDVDLNGRWSLPLADRLALAGVPHIFVTGYDAQILPDAYRATPRLTKPYADAALISTVSALCAQEDGSGQEDRGGQGDRE
jgi:DNA-binding response OmpR family regulator